LEVDRGGAVGEPELGGGDAAAAHAQVAAPDQPGDGALDHGPVWTLRNFSRLAVVHRSRSGQSWQRVVNRAGPAGLIVTVLPGAKVAAPAAVSMAESVLVNACG
jgi:hypothetical protein